MLATTESKITQGRKFWTQEILTKKNLEQTKYEKNFKTHEIRKRKFFVLTKYPREHVLDPRNTYKGTMAR